MTELTALRERIEARLALAEATAGLAWKAAEYDNGTMPRAYWLDTCYVMDTNGNTVCTPNHPEDARFIADRDPQAVATECRADLALLDFIETRTFTEGERKHRMPETAAALANLEGRYHS